MTTIEVKSRSRSIKSYSSNELTPDSNVQELINELSNDNKISEHRLRLTKLENGKQVALITHKTFVDNGIPESAEKLNYLLKIWVLKFHGELFSWLNILVHLFSIHCFIMFNLFITFQISLILILKSWPLPWFFCIFET